MPNPYNIQAIRILPMDKKEEFLTEEEVRRFLSVELILDQKGRYWYREQGMDIKNGYSLVLFQYDASIVGYGIAIKRVIDVCAAIVNGRKVQYNGYFQFLTMTVHNISRIELSEIQQIVPKITRFSQAKPTIEMEYYDDIYDLLLQKQVEFAENQL